MANENLGAAKRAKQDEFYTQWVDIEREMNAYLEYDPDVFRNKTILLPCDDPEWSQFTRYFALHFEDFGLKKLISTSYAPASNNDGAFYTPTLFEQDAVIYDPDKSWTRGRIFTLGHDDVSGDGRIDVDDLEWDYLEGDGDFRSDEVSALRDEADIVITNPPFSLFREFLAWLDAGGVRFSIIGNQNALTYKDVFPLVLGDRLWLGRGFHRGDAYFRVPEAAKIDYAAGVYNAETRTVHFRNVTWLTNLEHGRRHEPLELMTMDDNLKYSKRKVVRERGYQRYDNYDAIEVPFTEAIPSDYEGIMGVPLSFLERHNPDQFEILGATQRGCHDRVPDTKKYDDYREMRPDGTPTGASGNKTNENANVEGNDGKNNYFINDDGHVIQSKYQRIFIRKRQS